MPELRSAASFEGLIVLAVIYFLLATLSRAGRKRRGPAPGPPPSQPPEGTATEREGFSLESVLRGIERMKREAETRAPAPQSVSGRPHLPPPAMKPKPAGDRPRALPSVERQGRMATATTDQRPRALPSAERLGRMARAQTEAGPLGRHSRIRLPEAEEMEDRTSLEDAGSLEREARVEVLDDRRRPRVEVDHDEGAEAVVQRRIREAEARNREFSEVDYRQFHERIKEQAEAAPVVSRRWSNSKLREAIIWREILGPPKSLE